MANAPNKVGMDVVEGDHVPGSDEDEWSSSHSDEELFPGDDSFDSESSDDSFDSESSDESPSSSGSDMLPPAMSNRKVWTYEEGCDRCAVCFDKASVKCEACDDEFYCGPLHRSGHHSPQRMLHMSGHHCPQRMNMKRFCVPKGNAAPTEGDDDASPPVVQDAGLATLPWDVLLIICRRLDCEDLLRLGWVCRRLREVSRDAAAWEHASLYDWSLTEGQQCAVLLVAPALRRLRMSRDWPAVNLTRCTARVREFTLDWQGLMPYEVYMVHRLLRHYKGHLQVVRLGGLECTGRDGVLEVFNLLRAIDQLGIKELYVGSNLFKVYPGSTEVVDKLEVGLEVSELVLADALACARDTLTSFKVDAYRLQKNEWARGWRVPRALARCIKLEELRFPLRAGFNILNGLSCLRSLSLQDFGGAKHVAAQRFFASSPVARQLQRLTLHLSQFGHRGLIKAAAAGCVNVRDLTIVYVYKGMSSTIRVRVDAPRDLHAVLGSMGDLETLVLSKARVPSTVFKGLAAGALPNLRLLHLRLCSVTKKGLLALKRLRSRRKDLLVLERSLDHAYFYNPSEDSVFGFDLFAGDDSDLRCRRPMCFELSDCEEEDRVEDNLCNHQYDYDFVINTMNDGSDSEGLQEADSAKKLLAELKKRTLEASNGARSPPESQQSRV